MCMDEIPGLRRTACNGGECNGSNCCPTGENDGNVCFISDPDPAIRNRFIVGFGETQCGGAQLDFCFTEVLAAGGSTASQDVAGEEYGPNLHLAPGPQRCRSRLPPMHTYAD